MAFTKGQKIDCIQKIGFSHAIISNKAIDFW